MAIQTFPGGGMPFPAWPAGQNGTPNLGNLLLDADTEKAAVIFAATAAKQIHKIHIRTGTVTTGATVDLRVETVDAAANGDPTGTLWATNTNKTLAIANGDDNVWLSATLTADATVAIGDIVALVVANGTGGNLNISVWNDNQAGLPYADHFTAAWAKTLTYPLIIAEYSDGSFEPVYGFTDSGAPITTTTFATDTATTRRGNLFQLPFPSRTRGCWVLVDADGPFIVKLYDSAGTSVLAATATINQFQRQANGVLLQFYPWAVNGSGTPLTAGISLDAATNYRVVYEPTTTTDIVVYHFDVPAVAMLNMFPGGQNCHLTTYDGAAWSDAATTSRAYLGVFLDGFSDGVGGGDGVSGIIGDGASW